MLQKTGPHACPTRDGASTPWAKIIATTEVEPFPLVHHAPTSDTSCELSAPLAGPWEPTLTTAASSARTSAYIMPLKPQGASAAFPHAQPQPSPAAAAPHPARYRFSSSSCAHHDHPRLASLCPVSRRLPRYLDQLRKSTAEFPHYVKSMMIHRPVALPSPEADRGGRLFTR